MGNHPRQQESLVYRTPSTVLVAFAIPSMETFHSEGDTCTPVPWSSHCLCKSYFNYDYTKVITAHHSVVNLLWCW
ncbi:hypothetical protein VNO77_13504 [Canavalia gladiata]|uniref:Uncharacterized protein n=1 Tax=Canavalia gladiata TaxID=3824 RepID=A0AAN9LXW3_CANGL